jgi:RNA polymerase sigma-70 factor, ECF subfamily
VNIENEVILARKGDQSSFISLINFSRPTMYKVAKSILKNDEDCADAIQESILKSFKSLKTLKNPQYFKTWLTRILINECSKILNQRKNKVLLEQQNLSISHEDTYKDMEVWQAVKSLEDDIRTIVVLYYFEDISVKEIASILDIPQGTVKSRLSRARERLGQILKMGERSDVHE